MQSKPITRQFYTIIAEFNLKISTKIKLENLYPNYKTNIYAYLKQQLKDNIKNNYEKRKYVIEIPPNITTHNKQLSTTYFLQAQIYLQNPEDANVNEIVHKDIFNVNIETVQTLSGKVFTPVLDHTMMEILPHMDIEDAVKYYKRTE